MESMVHVCVECGRVADRLRRERCNACYMRLYRGGEVPMGTFCAACSENRHMVLMWVDIADTAHVLCGNCSLVLRRARPRLASVEALRARIPAASISARVAPAMSVAVSHYDDVHAVPGLDPALD